MFSVIACIRDNHDWRLIIAAAIVCLVGSLTMMLLLSRAQECDVGQRKLWIGTSAFAAGVGVWATHFIAMLAYDGGLPISYNLGLTSLSVVLSIFGSWVAILIASEGRAAYSFAFGGLLMALGVTAMHLTGMQAIEAQAVVVYDAFATVIAFSSCAALSFVAFLAFFKLKGMKRFAASSIAFVLAICTLHFISMSSIALVPDPAREVAAKVLAPEVLAAIVMAVSTGLILMSFGAVFLESHLTDLRGLANVSQDGLVILREGRIVDTNERFLALSGWKLSELTGNTPSSVLVLIHVEQESDHKEMLLIAKDEREIPVEVVTRSIVYRGRYCDVLVVRDLSERKRTEELIEHLAHHDVLTDLPNRSLFDTRIRQALHVAERKRTEVALVCIDLDRFKAVNDIFGHAEGDRILRKVAVILKRCVDADDTIARLGGDEFAIVQPGKKQPDAARRLASRIIDEFAAEMDTARDPTAVGASIGIALYPADGKSAEELYNNADTALYRVKHAGRGAACFFDAEMDESVRTRRQIEHELRHAILRRQLHVNYQPILDARSGEINGYEALMRWNRPGHGMSEPDIFIPIAEESGSIVQLGEWILREACMEAARWPQPLTIAVNVSPVQFLLPNLCERVTDILKEARLAPQRLELEITEAALVRDRKRVMSTLQRLRALGVRIVMDDFGTGFSSLSNLRSFPFDKIKVDRSFTGVLEHDAGARSIVRAIIGLGHSLGMPVVTEGVETEMQRQIVVDEGCAQVQGLLLGKPDIEPSIKLAARENSVGATGPEAQVIKLKRTRNRAAAERF
ncbi:diguanylate cyclase (GGDEF)-like protein/PAS domain S-box-containing protein [Rhizobium sp. BK529]|uniref:bifunctional diguanylate cyclase/phosphodiesterase n=1 Tax=Rhizobium sp. BK529 TaxID=2586983 RepID=UPI0016226DEC|nr:EAL domain-containing protein [Rhizobium sp. BK529]MBB3592994.1 diguanylate cyclase (GGDEF)-like protein/PAS domain S-box-containing protein [Rhizobium sp. BK529]